jgi:hypothetical protein
MAYGFEKLSHDPSSLTDLTLGLVVSKKVISVVEDMIAIAE